MRKIAIMLLAALAGCETVATLPVSGVFDTKAEKFIGQVTADLATGTGKINVNTQQGATCTGGYQQPPKGMAGAGTMSCSDGRTGEFRYISQGAYGEGIGKMTNGDTFSFKFGSSRPTGDGGRVFAEGMQALGDAMKGPTRTNTECFSSGGMLSCSTR